MNRRRLLEAVAASVALAGCAGRSGREPPDGSDAAATPTPSPTTSATPTAPPPYDGATVTDAAPCPERPESWTRSTVESFLLAFERAYLERSIRRQTDDVTDVSHDFGLSVAGLTEVDAGYLATLSGGYAVYYGGTVHGDVFDYEARYLVAGGAVEGASETSPDQGGESGGVRLRRTASTGEAADPREAGQRVFCPPRNPQEPP